jgi:protein-tyrosine phosphatase
MTQIDLEGAHNVRDLDGLAAGDASTRPGVLLRSDALDGLTATDVAVLVDEYHLAHVVDLRSRAERVERGRGLLGEHADVHYSDLDVIDEAALARRQDTRASSFAAGIDPNIIISDGYVELLELGAPAFAAAFGAVVRPGGTPALVHCAIGKDRTGVLTALLLDAAAVERGEIVADYARTGERMAPIIERWMVNNRSRGMSEQVAAFTATAAPETMDHLLTVLHERWGGAAAYLVANGQPAAAVDAWREMFVDPT